MEEVAVHACRKVLMAVDDNIIQMVGNPQGILDKMLRPRPIHLFNIINVPVAIILS
jgi:hypothetical protein